MVFAVEPASILGSIGILLSAIVAALALYQTRRTESKTATREEVQQAFDLQDKAMVELEASNVRLTTEIERVRDKNDQMHKTLNDTFAKMNELRGEHRKCQDDLNALGMELRTVKGALHIAEAKIAELGG